MNDDYDLDELRAEARAQRRFQQRLLNHPDPRDPDFPEMEDSDE